MNIDTSIGLSISISLFYIVSFCDAALDYQRFVSPKPPEEQYRITMTGTRRDINNLALESLKILKELILTKRLTDLEKCLLDKSKHTNRNIIR